LALALIACLPGVQVLFFYPEVYGPALTAHLALVLAITLGSELAVLSVLLVALRLHAVAFALAPLALWTAGTGLARRLRAGEGPLLERLPRRELFAVLVVLGLLLWALVTWLDPEANWMLRGNFVGVAETSNYSLGSRQWLLDRLGLLAWVAVPTLILLPAALTGLRATAGRGLRIPAALAVGPHIVYLATWNCTQGVYGDWDLFAVSGLVFAWFAAEATARLSATHPARRIVGPVAVSVGAALTLCFVLANASPGGGIHP